MARTENLNVAELKPLITPRALKEELPQTATANATVIEARKTIGDILSGVDPRLLIIVGPCSIHDPVAAVEYAQRLAELRKELSRELFIVMRVYFEKPRTTIGWKGLIYDPHLDGSSDIERGLYTARRLLLAINTMGVPTGTEMLDPVVPQYIADLVSWAAIGARTTESQIHRQMASGLSMPVGFKNRTDGNIQVAIDAMESARHHHSFIGIDQDGRTSIVNTTGNTGGHIILRGSRSGPNYDVESLRDAAGKIAGAGLTPRLLLDCSHGNTGKRFELQEQVLLSGIEARAAGTTALIGMMIESHLHEGCQAMTPNPADLRYGVSITDACVGWPTTVEMLKKAAAIMAPLIKA